MEWISGNIEKETDCNGPGIYRIRLFKDSEPVEIRRFVGRDKEGILVIGRSDNIERRRKQFISSSKGCHGHSEGIQWFLVKYHWSELAENHTLRFEYKRPNGTQDQKKIEAEEIWRYFQRFLEAPPLNGVIPRRKERFEERRPIRSARTRERAR